MFGVDAQRVLRRVVVLLLLSTPAPAFASPLMVMPLAGEDATDLAQALRDRLKGNSRYAVLGSDETQGILEQTSDMGLDCLRSDIECLCKIGVLGNIATILSVTTVTDPSGASLVLLLIDVEQGTELRRVKRTLRGAPNTIALDALDELIDPENYLGTLEIEVTSQQGRLFVDGELWGEAPLLQSRRLRPGMHEIEFSAAAEPSQRRTVEVSKGATTQIRIDAPKPPTTSPQEPTTEQTVTVQPSWQQPTALISATVALIFAAVGALSTASTGLAYVIGAWNAEVPNLRSEYQLGDPRGVRAPSLVRLVAWNAIPVLLAIAAGAAIGSAACGLLAAIIFGTMVVPSALEE